VTGYLGDERQSLMRAADATPFKPDGSLRNRVEELGHFARGRGMKRIGIAFCVSLLAESQRLAGMLQSEGLETELVCCRVGAVDHDTMSARWTWSPWSASAWDTISCCSRSATRR
jgi:uncharacterized metal-binding protein